MRSAPLAELFEFQAILERLFVLMAHVPQVLTLGALEFDDIVLRHMVDYSTRECYQTTGFPSS